MNNGQKLLKWMTEWEDLLTLEIPISSSAWKEDQKIHQRTYSVHCKIQVHLLMVEMYNEAVYAPGTNT
jgi:hypothetical protein